MSRTTRTQQSQKKRTTSEDKMHEVDNNMNEQPMTRAGRRAAREQESRSRKRDSQPKKSASNTRSRAERRVESDAKKSQLSNRQSSAKMKSSRANNGSHVKNEEQLPRKKNQPIRSEKKGSSSRKPSTKKGKLAWRIWTVIFCIMLVGTIAVGAIGIIAYIDMKKDMPSLELEDIVTKDLSTVIDANGNPVGNLAEDAQVLIKPEDVSQSFTDAMIATEDARYLRHNGIDGPRTMQALVDLVVTRNIVSGGSTITQQVIQNTILQQKMQNNEEYRNSKLRKIEEWILAYKLEKKLTKEEIFEAYINNVISFGRHVGVGTAAKRYFNKSAAELTVPEAALLAGIPQKSSNNPFIDIEEATDRYQSVLSLMARHGYITKKEAEEFKKIPLADLIDRENEEPTSPFSSFYNTVEEELSTLWKLETAAEVASLYQNYDIYTTLMPEHQLLVNEVMDTNNYVDWETATNNVYGYDTEKTADDLLNYQGAMTIVANASGEIPAIGASRGFNQTGSNIAVNGFKSPGSSIKPIIDYAPYVEKFSVSASHPMNDAPTYYTGGSEVYNYNHGGYEGYVPLEYALGISKNTTAIRALQSSGLEYAGEMTKNMGLSRVEPLMKAGELYESAGLGGGLETTTTEMAGAYATFANAGVHNTPHTVRKVVKKDSGQTVYEFEEKEEVKQVMAESTAATMVQALIFSNSSGTPVGGGRVHPNWNLQVGSKTGTSSYDPGEGVHSYAEKDHWQVTITPDYSVAAWTGLAVEGPEVLEKTGGNVNANKHWGSRMIAPYLDAFANPELRFEFLGSQNTGGGTGSINGLHVSVDENTATWGGATIAFPTGLTDDEKAEIGGVEYQVTVSNSCGNVITETHSEGGSISVASLKCGDDVDYDITIHVTAKTAGGKADKLIPPIEASDTRGFKAKNKKPDVPVVPDPTPDPVTDNNDEGPDEGESTENRTNAHAILWRNKFDLI